MSFSSNFRHWLAPHHTNNFRARLLHNSGVFAVIGIILTGNVFLRLLDDPSLNILGFTSSISIDQVVRATNEQRLGSGLKPLVYSERLADAARRKAANMISENYWSHVSPSGLSPWTWFKAAGYSYIFAGENLAKDFGDTGRMMNAWMASPSHRDNITNTKYTEIGVAVVPGALQGSDTMLVVQLFGTPSGGSVTPAVSAKPAAPKKIAKVIPTPAPVVVAEVKGEEVVASAALSPVVAPAASPKPEINPKINEFSLARGLNLATTALFILVLLIDLIIAETHKLSRRVGNNWAHIIFINLILLATFIVNAGKIL